MRGRDGQARTPYVVHRQERPGVSLDRSPEQLAGLRQAMINVVERGTARGSRLASITIAGKTGTAQNPHRPAHGWFIAFAPADHPKIVVGAIIESAPQGPYVPPFAARARRGAAAGPGGPAARLDPAHRHHPRGHDPWPHASASSIDRCWR